MRCVGIGPQAVDVKRGFPLATLATLATSRCPCMYHSATRAILPPSVCGLLAAHLADGVVLPVIVVLPVAATGVGTNATANLDPGCPMQQQHSCFEVGPGHACNPVTQASTL